MAKQPTPPMTAAPGNLPGRVLVMPAYYLPRAKNKMSMTALLAIIVSAVVVVSVVVVIILLSNRPESAPIAPVVETPLNPQPTQPTLPTTPVPEPEAPVTVPEPTTGPVANLPVVPFALIAADIDTDQDALTDVEEQIFLTSAAVPDTDQDNFLDGIEVKNLYDPATPGALLEVSPRIKIARNNSFGYQLLIPATWTATNNAADGSMFLIRPLTGTETFRIDVYQNLDRVSVTEWYQLQTPNADLTQFVNFANEAGWTGIQTTDHRLVIATLDDNGPGSRAFMFVMTYDAGTETRLSYSTVWDMITNSLAVLVPAPAATTTPTVNQ